MENVLNDAPETPHIPLPHIDGLPGLATKWSLVSSSGFLLAAIVMSGLFIYFDYRKQRKNKQKKKADREPGRFAVFMFLLELIDAIPEAAVIAQSTINRTIGWSFVISILSLNLVNTSASAVDFLATSNSKKLHRFLFALLFFSVGMLCYSISADVYGKFAELFKTDERGAGDMACLMFGTFVGFSLIIFLMRLEHKIHSQQNEKEDDTLLHVLDMIHEQLLILNPKLQSYFHRQERKSQDAQMPYASIGLQDPQAQYSSFGSLGRLDLSPIRVRRHPVAEPPDDADVIIDCDEIQARKAPRRPHFEDEDDVELVELSEVNVTALMQRANSLHEMEILVSFLYSWNNGHNHKRLALVEDFSAFLAEKTMANIQGEEFVDSPKKLKPRQAMKKLLHQSNEATIEPPSEMTSLVGWASFRNGIYWRSIKFLFLMLIVFVWSVLLTWAMAVFLEYIESLSWRMAELMEAFCEGLSGGAFLSTISGTMIFRIQQDFYGSEWGVNTSKMIGMSCFVFGIVFSNFIAMLEHNSASGTPT
eukprot:TRINITY_DN10643_c0_g1_i1.p1 TRINITY_DN10643_c0_g1~~TRINITY_DN10643_c0_g1_i1.p1  ORF type:complete len:533 (-),score=88.91 TRINITY_DN10643_c0_g1_i1:64-1662(-)